MLTPSASEKPLYKLPKGKPTWLLVRSDSGAGMDSVFAELRKRYEGRVNFVRIDEREESAQDAMQEFSLDSAPASVLGDAKGGVVEKFEGKRDSKEIAARLEAMLGD